MKKILSIVAITAAAAMANLAHATPSLSFAINGDTFGATFSFTNTSTAGENISRFVLDLSTITAGGPYCFDTVVGGACNPDPQSPYAFTPDVAAAALTGLYAPLTVADGATVLDLRFNDFNPGETFSWMIDVDSVTELSVFGNMLAGATVSSAFSNGMTATGILAVDSNNLDSSVLSITGVAPTTDLPEPGSLALMGLAGAGMLLRRKRK